MFLCGHQMAVAPLLSYMLRYCYGYWVIGTFHHWQWGVGREQWLWSEGFEFVHVLFPFAQGGFPGSHVLWCSKLGFPCSHWSPQVCIADLSHILRPLVSVSLTEWWHALTSGSGESRKHFRTWTVPRAHSGPGASEVRSHRGKFETVWTLGHL